jgi:hypothetical protein
MTRYKGLVANTNMSQSAFTQPSFNDFISGSMGKCAITSHVKPNALETPCGWNCPTPVGRRQIYEGLEIGVISKCSGIIISLVWWVAHGRSACFHHWFLFQFQMQELYCSKTPKQTRRYFLSHPCDYYSYCTTTVLITRGPLAARCRQDEESNAGPDFCECVVLSSFELHCMQHNKYFVLIVSSSILERAERKSIRSLKDVFWLAESKTALTE